MVGQYDRSLKASERLAKKVTDVVRRGNEVTVRTVTYIDGRVSELQKSLDDFLGRMAKLSGGGTP